MDRPAAFLGQRGDGLHLLQHLQAGLGLPGLGGLGAEPVDEGLHVLALRVLLFLGLLLQHHGFAPLPVETVIAAAVEGQLAPVQMHDGINRLVEEVAVVRDQQHLMRIARHIAFQPQCSFQIEIVGRLVEQQQIRLGEKHRRQRHAHAPAAGKGRAGPLLRFCIKAKAVQNGGSTGLRRVGGNIGKAGVDGSDPVRVLRRFRLCHQGGALRVGGQHHFNQAFLRTRRFLRHLADAGKARHADGAAFTRQIAGDQLEQGGFARAIAAHKAGLAAGGQGDAGIVDEKTAADAIGEV